MNFFEAVNRALTYEVPLRREYFDKYNKIKIDCFNELNQICDKQLKNERAEYYDNLLSQIPVQPNECINIVNSMVSKESVKISNDEICEYLQNLTGKPCTWEVEDCKLNLYLDDAKFTVAQPKHAVKYQLENELFVDTFKNFNWFSQYLYSIGFLGYIEYGSLNYKVNFPSEVITYIENYMKNIVVEDSNDSQK